MHIVTSSLSLLHASIVIEMAMLPAWTAVIKTTEFERLFIGYRS